MHSSVARKRGGIQFEHIVLLLHMESQLIGFGLAAMQQII